MPPSPPATTTNNAGRLKTLTNGGSTETSVYNALGQRIQISGGVNGTVLYSYDEAGHLLGEYDGTGTLIEETVWLGDIPVATLKPSGSSVALFYIHSDPLNTPRQITRPSDNTAMWTWNSDPFGTDAANPNPSGAGAFAYNLRFPGQVCPNHHPGPLPLPEQRKPPMAPKLEPQQIVFPPKWRFGMLAFG
jgi:uncharacterized protein RhaS with RHS repeats